MLFCLQNSTTLKVSNKKIMMNHLMRYVKFLLDQSKVWEKILSVSEVVLYVHNFLALENRIKSYYHEEIEILRALHDGLVG